jgi:hypothetical protein
MVSRPGYNLQSRLNNLQRTQPYETKVTFFSLMVYLEGQEHLILRYYT